MAEESEIDYAALSTAKIVSMIILGLISFGLSLLPLFLVKIFKWDVNVIKNNYKTKLALSMLLCFGAGVLLCTSFMHMLPELRLSVEEQMHSGGFPETEIPLTEIFFLTGFFVIYLVEEIVHLIYGNKIHGHGHSHHDNHGNSQIDLENDVKMDHETSKSELVKPKLTVYESFLETLSGMLVVLALSFHAIFEGLAVGLEMNATDVWLLMGAVAAHKFVIAFCVGAELLVAGTKTVLLVIYVATFAATTTLGIGIGMALTSSAELSSPVTVVLEGMAAGTLVYVVFFEVLHRERISSPDAGIFQYIAVLVGLIVMFGLLNVGPHAHDHDHDHDHDDDHSSTTHEPHDLFTQNLTMFKYLTGHV